MQPSDGFWEGVGSSVGTSPGWMIVVAALVIGVLFITAKYIVPSRERIKMRELDIREREAANEADNIKVRSAMGEQMSGLRESNQNLAQQTAAMTARLNESAMRSREMGGEVHDVKSAADHIKETTDDTNAMVKDIHRRMVFGEGTD